MDENDSTGHLKSLVVTWKTFQRWSELRDGLNLQSDDSVAEYLLDRCDGRHHETSTERQDVSIEKTKQLKETKRFTASSQEVCKPVGGITHVPAVDNVPGQQSTMRSQSTTDESLSSLGPDSGESAPSLVRNSGGSSNTPSLVQVSGESKSSPVQDSGGSEPSLVQGSGGSEPSLVQNSGGSKPSLVQNSVGSMPSLVKDSGGSTNGKSEREKSDNGEIQHVPDNFKDFNSPSHQCVSCKLEFDDKESLATHAKEKHDVMYMDSLNSKMIKLIKSDQNKTVISIPQRVLTPNSFTCNVCKRKFPTAEGIEKHKIKEHGKVDKFKCRLCVITYSTKRGLSMHMVRDHPGSPQKPYRCSLCELAFSGKEELGKHVRIVHFTNFMCRFCQRVFSNVTKFKEHERELHVENEDGTVTNHGYECQACKQFYKTLMALATHTSAYCKKKNLTFSCNKCKDGFENAVLLENHYKEVHSEAVDVGTKCSCGKVFTNDVARKQHRCKRRVQCQYCDKSYKVQGSLDQHIAVVHSTEKPKFPCEKCGKVYNRIQNLRYHRAVHMKGIRKKFKCELCSKEYTSKQSLGDHVRKHTGDKLICPQCGKNFASMKILRHHEKMIHTKKRTHACHLCQKAYYDSYTLSRHIDSHFGKRTLKCKFCDKTFVYSSGRALHQKTQHREEHEAYMRNVRENNHVERFGPGAFQNEVKLEMAQMENEDDVMDSISTGSETEVGLDMVEVRF